MRVMATSRSSTYYKSRTHIMRIAAIDIGTNSVHMIVVRVRADLSFEVIDREKAMVRLGAGGLDGKALTADAMSAALQALSSSSGWPSRIGSTRSSPRRPAPRARRATAASSWRASSSETGIRAARHHRRRKRRGSSTRPRSTASTSAAARAVVIDIGGGSVEITLGTATAIQLARSFKLGVIRLTERFVKSDPLASRDERRLVKHILREIDAHCEQITAAGFDRVIGTSGTILSLGAVAATAARGAAPAGAAQPARARRSRSAACARTSSRSISSSG